MSQLFMIRHGQASFLSANYDQLSPIGHQQSECLARYWLEHGLQFDEVYAGTLQRQLQTAETVGSCFGDAEIDWPKIQPLPGLNEYLADSVMDILRRELVDKHAHVRQLDEEHEQAASEHQRYRTFHRLLEALMHFYILADYESSGFETWREFHDRVTTAIQSIRNQSGRGRKVAIFTSGGPVGVAVQTTLQAPELQAGALNWRVYNASITQFTFSQDRISLDQFNGIPHLSANLQTYR